MVKFTTLSQLSQAQIWELFVGLVFTLGSLSKQNIFFFPRVLGCVLKACQQKDLCGGKTLPKVKIGFAVLAHLFIFSVLQAVRVTCFSVQVPVSEGLALI